MKDTYYEVKFKNNDSLRLFLGMEQLERLLSGMDEKTAQNLIVTERRVGVGVVQEWSN